jgi:thiosulfate/3-mercaptopyruvate sulfurtransferase
MVRINGKTNQPRKWIALLVFVLAFGLIFMVAGLTAQAVPNGGYVRPEVLIQPQELKALVDKKDPHTRIIDVREKSHYLSGHIPGAVQIWRPDIEDKNHSLPGMMAPKGQMKDLLGSLGISNQNTLIIYSDGPDNGRLWWVLAYYGFPLKQMRILDGSIDAWKSNGYPVEVGAPKVERVKFRLPEKGQERGPLLCTLPEVKSALKNPDRVVLDVRSKKEFLGEETRKGAPKAGRIPGVTWIEWTEALVGEGLYKGYWKSAEEIQRVFSTKGVTPEKDVFMY